MVRWFSPPELVRSGVKALLSSLFGAYADKREIQALQRDAPTCDFSTDGDLWLDYVADLGDGFDSTHTVARVLSESRLNLDSPSGNHSTQRGRVLIMGGDQIYPTATRDEYNNRLVGPYRAALPCVPIDDEEPTLFAVPGNHDWYDGLTSFVRLFCQHRHIGAWKTEQERGYFALKLSETWWLWGIDIQLAADIDEPQLRYFERIAREEMAPGSSIILCTAEPTWVFAAQDGAETYDNLAFFERKVMAPFGHHFAVGLSGDLHTYARYQEMSSDDAERPMKHRFVSGGGGAYLYPTHNLPDRLDLPAHTSVNPDIPIEESYSLRNGTTEGPDERTVFPSTSRSRVLAIGALQFPWRNRSFAALLGGFYLFFAWILQSASVPRPHNLREALPALEVPSLLDRFAAGWSSLGQAAGHILEILKHGPGSVLLLALLVGGLIGFAKIRNPVLRIIAGTLHAAIHLALIVGLMWLFAWLNTVILASLGITPPRPVEHPLAITLFAIQMVLIGGALAGFVMGGYLFVANVIAGVHCNEVLLCQSRPDYKNFLRLRLDRDENLTIYPVGIEKPCHDWKLNSEGMPGDPWFKSESWAERMQGPPEKRSTLYRLIEDPVVVRPARVIRKAAKTSTDADLVKGA